MVCVIVIVLLTLFSQCFAALYRPRDSFEHSVNTPSDNFGTLSGNFDIFPDSIEFNQNYHYKLLVDELFQHEWFDHGDKILNIVFEDVNVNKLNEFRFFRTTNNITVLAHVNDIEHIIEGFDTYNVIYHFGFGNKNISATVEYHRSSEDITLSGMIYSHHYDDYFKGHHICHIYPHNGKIELANEEASYHNFPEWYNGSLLGDFDLEVVMHPDCEYNHTSITGEIMVERFILNGIVIEDYDRRDDGRIRKCVEGYHDQCENNGWEKLTNQSSTHIQYTLHLENNNENDVIIENTDGMFIGKDIYQKCTNIVLDNGSLKGVPILECIAYTQKINPFTHQFGGLVSRRMEWIEETQNGLPYYSHKYTTNIRPGNGFDKIPVWRRASSFIDIDNPMDNWVKLNASGHIAYHIKDVFDVDQLEKLNRDIDLVIEEVTDMEITFPSGEKRNQSDIKSSFYRQTRHYIMNKFAHFAYYTEGIIRDKLNADITLYGGWVHAHYMDDSYIYVHKDRTVPYPHNKIYTVIIYLNDFEGGRTYFPDTDEYVEAAGGDILVFEGSKVDHCCERTIGEKKVIGVLIVT